MQGQILPLAGGSGQTASQGKSFESLRADRHGDSLLAWPRNFRGRLPGLGAFGAPRHIQQGRCDHFFK